MKKFTGHRAVPLTYSVIFRGYRSTLSKISPGKGVPNILLYVNGKERGSSFVNQLNPALIEKVEFIIRHCLMYYLWDDNQIMQNV